jgi:hypothetical protein
MFLAMENQFFILLLFQKHDFYFYVFLLFFVLDISLLNITFLNQKTRSMGIILLYDKIAIISCHLIKSSLE